MACNNNNILKPIINKTFREPVMNVIIVARHACCCIDASLFYTFHPYILQHFLKKVCLHLFVITQTCLHKHHPLLLQWGEPELYLSMKYGMYVDKWLSKNKEISQYMYIVYTIVCEVTNIVFVSDHTQGKGVVVCRMNALSAEPSASPCGKYYNAHACYL